jgi:hypothetical protein
MPSYPRGARTFWCECDCGQARRMRLAHLASGAVKSCGCFSREQAAARGMRVEAGQRFGRGTVVDPRIRIFFPSVPAGQPGARLACDCGGFYETPVHTLYSGMVKSCGCLHREFAATLASAYSTTHGMGSHPLYDTWWNMMRRCENEQHKGFRRYGGRGISVCPEWRGTAAFITWIESNLGPRPEGMSLDRIDNDGNYEPGNVRWATRSEQNLNREISRPAAG